MVRSAENNQGRRMYVLIFTKQDLWGGGEEEWD